MHDAIGEVGGKATGAFELMLQQQQQRNHHRLWTAPRHRHNLKME